MSLKAKLEAVIYAAEEPVTLAQLAMLFAEEALAWRAESAAAPQFALQTDERKPDTVNPDDGGSVESAAATTSAEAMVSESAVAESSGAVDSVEGEAQVRRLARMRDREVRNALRAVLDELVAEYAGSDRGIEIREIAGGYRMATKPECHDAVRAFVKSLKPALKLSLPALETLAVIAYKQPVTAPEVAEIRGVDTTGVLGSLISRKLITTAGRKQVVGRPMLYKTTREFLLRFGLKDVAELPSMDEFEKMAAQELAEPETDAGPNAGPEGSLESPLLIDGPALEPEPQPSLLDESAPLLDQAASQDEDSLRNDDAPLAAQEVEANPADAASNEDYRATQSAAPSEVGSEDGREAASNPWDQTPNAAADHPGPSLAKPQDS